MEHFAQKPIISYYRSFAWGLRVLGVNSGVLQRLNTPFRS